MRKVDPNGLWLAEWSEAIYWGDGKRYRYYPGDICQYNPKSKAKEAEKFRGREVEILWMAHKLDKVAIKFLDTGKEGRAYLWDLLVIKRKAVDFTKYRETGEHRSLENSSGVKPSPITLDQRH